MGKKKIANVCVCVCQDASPNSLDKHLSNMKQQSLQQDRNLSGSITFTFSNVYHVVFEIFHLLQSQETILSGLLFRWHLHSPNQQRLGIAGLTTAANGIAYVTSNKKEPSVGASRGSWTKSWRRTSWDPCGRRR